MRAPTAFGEVPEEFASKYSVHLEGKILCWIDDLAHHIVSRRNPRMCARIGDPGDEDQLRGLFAPNGANSLVGDPQPVFRCKAPWFVHETENYRWGAFESSGKPPAIVRERRSRNHLRSDEMLCRPAVLGHTTPCVVVGIKNDVKPFAGRVVDD